jgi:hypothetical protein
MKVYYEMDDSCGRVQAVFIRKAVQHWSLGLQSGGPLLMSFSMYCAHFGT